MLEYMLPFLVHEVVSFRSSRYSQSRGEVTRPKPTEKPTGDLLTRSVEQRSSVMLTVFFGSAYNPEVSCCFPPVDVTYPATLLQHQYFTVTSRVAAQPVHWCFAHHGFGVDA